MECTRADLPAVTIAAVRATVPMSQLTEFYDRAYAQVTTAAGREGWTLAGPAFGWYHRVPTDTVELTAGFVVDGAPLGTCEEVEVSEMPGGAALVLIHTGPYDALPDAWGRLEKERAELGIDGRGDFWEEYVTEPAPDRDPDLNITRLVLPLNTDG